MNGARCIYIENVMVVQHLQIIFRIISYIGGVPDIDAFTGGKFSQNFNGCIHMVEGSAGGIANIETAAVGGLNVKSCPK